MACDFPRFRCAVVPRPGEGSLQGCATSLVIIEPEFPPGLTDRALHLSSLAPERNVIARDLVSCEFIAH
jgi:hypothetical protein